MDRIAIVGSGGAGKTTFADELGRRSGLPVLHLDHFYWKPGWVETPRDEWRALQTELAAKERWIIDGSYRSTFDLRFVRADTVIVLAPSRWRCVVRALRRSIARHGQAVQAAGCPERISLPFLWWVWRYPSNTQPQLASALARHADHLRVIELKSSDEYRAFLDRS